MKLSRVLTDRGTEYGGTPERHEYELYLALEDVDHSRTKTKSPQTNGIVERFHKTVLDEFYRVAFRKRIYGSIAELKADLDGCTGRRSVISPGEDCLARQRTRRAPAASEWRLSGGAKDERHRMAKGSVRACASKSCLG